MPNGMPLTVMHGGTSEVFRMDILVYGGQWRQQLPLQSAFTNNMLSEGTRQLSSSQISDLLDRYGAWMMNDSQVDYSVITLFSLNKYARETLDVVAQMLQQPTFPEHEFQVLVSNKRQQFQVSQQRVDRIAHRTCSQALLGKNHPCTKYAQLDDYQHIQTSHLKQFYQQHYHSGNAAIYLSGRVNDGVRQLVENRFGASAWGSQSAVSQVAPVPYQPVADTQIFIEKSDSQQSAVRLGLLSIPVNHPEYDQLNILNTVLGGYFGSRLMTNIREEKGYTYGIGSGFVPIPFNTIWVFVTECAHEYVQPLIQEVHTEFQRIRQELIPMEELQMVQNTMLGEFSRLVDNVLSLSDVYISAQTQGLPDDYVQHRIQAIQQITPESLQQLAQKYLQIQQMKEVVVGKKI